MIRSPAASSARRGAPPSPNSAIFPSDMTTQPRSITRSARTIRALPKMVSWLVALISFSSLCRRGKQGHIDNPVRDQMAYFVVMDDGDHRDALALLLFDQFHHDGAIGGVERRRRLVQQQDRQLGNE